MNTKFQVPSGPRCSLLVLVSWKARFSLNQAAGNLAKDTYGQVPRYLAPENNPMFPGDQSWSLLKIRIPPVVNIGSHQLPA